MLYSLLDKHSLETVCIKIWGVWKDRRNFIHIPNKQGLIYQEDHTSHWSRAFLESYRAALLYLKPALPSQHHKAQEGYNEGRLEGYKAYVDAAFNNEKREYATTFVIYDHEGNLWAIGLRKIHSQGTGMAA